MIDRHSQAWLTVQREVKARIEEQRDLLEREGLSPDLNRGEIRALRWVLTLGEPRQEDTEPAEIDYLQSRTPDPT